MFWLGRADVLVLSNGSSATSDKTGAGWVRQLPDRARARPRLVTAAHRCFFGWCLNDIQGVLNDGGVSLSGDLELDRFALKGMKVRARLDEVSYVLGEDFPLKASGELPLSGQPEALALRGTMDHLRPIAHRNFKRSVRSPYILERSEAQ